MDGIGKGKGVKDWYCGVDKNIEMNEAILICQKQNISFGQKLIQSSEKINEQIRNIIDYNSEITLNTNDLLNMLKNLQLLIYKRRSCGVIVPSLLQRLLRN